MKKVISAILIFVMLFLASCKNEYISFTAVVMGSYNDYISAYTASEAVPFSFADIKVNVKTLGFKVPAGTVINVEAKSLTEGDDNVYTVVPAKITKTDTAYKTVTGEEAKELIKNGAVLLDTRSALEYKLGHIKGAVNLPEASVKKKYKQVLPDFNTPIVCTAKNDGGSSEQTAKMLLTLGYTAVYDLGAIEKYGGEIVAE